jgi:hypothetical protein
VGEANQQGGRISPLMLICWIYEFTYEFFIKFT